MKIHESNTDPEILEGCDHIRDAEYGWDNLPMTATGEKYWMGITVRALIRSIEVLQQHVDQLEKKSGVS